MTALCGGGNSAPQIGTAAVVDYASGLIATILAKASAGWLIPIIPLMGLPPLVLSTFCGSDPLAMPSFTQAEADALLHLTLGADFQSGLAKLPALLQNIVWNDACRCTSGVYTAAPLPTQPAGSTTVVLVGPHASGPCRTFPPTVLAAVGPPAQSNIDSWFPSGVTPTLLTAQATSILAGAGFTYQLGFTWSDGVTLTTSMAPAVFTGGQPGSISMPLPTSFIRQLLATMEVVGGGTAPGDSVTMAGQWYCGGQLPGAMSPCCPPDTATDATLRTILALVKDIQRNYAPFGYVVSTAHAGLTGTGTIAVSRLLGAKVAVTGFPSSDVQLPGNPAYVKDLGWMSVSEVDGMIQEQRIARLAFTWFPQLMPLADHINYFLNPGVTATITELRPEF